MIKCETIFSCAPSGIHVPFLGASQTPLGPAFQTEFLVNEIVRLSMQITKYMVVILLSDYGLASRGKGQIILT